MKALTVFCSRIALLLAAFLFAASLQAGTTVYVTADNGAGTNLFGTLNLRTGRFHQIATTKPLFYALTTGPEGRIYGADLRTGKVYTISASGGTRRYGSIIAPGVQYGFGYGFLGLAYPGAGGQLFAINVDPRHVTLDLIGENGNSLTDIGITEGPDTGIFYGGNLTFGPFGRLYFDFSAIDAGGNPVPMLYTIDPTTGAPTAVGSGLGSEILTLFSDGARLYGINTVATTDIGIYIVNTRTGVAVPTGVTVTGLPRSDHFYIDTATFAHVDD